MSKIGVLPGCRAAAHLGVVVAVLCGVGIGTAPNALAAAGGSGATTGLPGCRLLLPAGQPQSLPAAPSGLISLSHWSGGTGAPVPAAVLSDHQISGIQLQTPWSALEPHPGHYQFGAISTVLTEAAAQGKFVVLTIIPGFHTPRWALAGVPRIRSSWSYKVSIQNGHQLQPRPLPIPWNPLYLCRWFTFLDKIAGTFASNPALAMIDVAGPNSVSTEMSLPSWTGEGGNPLYNFDQGLPPQFDGSDMKMWLTRGYTAGKYIHAWRTALTVFRDLFPDQYTSLNLIGGLPIGDDTITGSQITATTLSVIAAARQILGPAASIQADGLGSSTGSQPPGVYVAANCGRTVTGFQTRAPAREGTLTPVDLEAGVAAGADFIEVYDSSVVAGLQSYAGPSGDPNYDDDATTQQAIDTVVGQLPANHGCAPLTLTATPATGTIGTPATVTATAEPTLMPALTFTINAFKDPFGSFSFTGEIGIYDNGRLIKDCAGTGATCTTTVGVIGERRRFRRASA